MSAPLLLGVDTATDVASWALWRGDALVAERAAAPGRPAAEVLLPLLDDLLAGAGVTLDEVAGYAVSLGPGSFTGLRVGVATVKGLALSPPRPAWGVPTLEALALHASGPGPVAAVLDARRGEVYAAGFAWDGQGDPVAADWLPEGVVPIADLAAALPPGTQLVGDAVALCADALGGRDVRAVPPPYAATTARHVAALAVRRYTEDHPPGAGALVPRYVRRAEAEAKRTGERFEASR